MNCRLAKHKALRQSDYMEKSGMPAQIPSENLP